ncbi:MAG: tRNA epoxyqueuosine(34) reductase QueG [Bacteroidales bacterium]|nr:tRNA epoxyqueuosine(34) reductase QueG [Bacteroidales bacterium]
MNKEQADIQAKIKAEAIRLGFSDCGFSTIEPLSQEKTFLLTWLKQSYHADLQYMANNIDKREHADLLVEEAKSVISLSLNYYKGDISYEFGQAKISKYALGRDYHKVVKKKLKALFQYIEILLPHFKGRYFVDSAPVMDKVWAVKSGLGWMGKNGNIIHPKRGSFFFIGEIISNLEVESYHDEIQNYCGTCRRCIEACPTQAIVSNAVIDARRCISYQTIENKGSIPNNIVPLLNDYIFGCDICQDVCPWNNKVAISSEIEFGTLDVSKLNYRDYLKMNEEEFNTLFEGSPVKRAGYLKIQNTVKQILSHRNENLD